MSRLSLPSPENITRAELPNGLVLLVYENDSSPSVVIGGYLWAGAIGEPAEQAGLAGFTAGMLMRGTQRRSFAEMNDALESVGARLGFSGGVHTVGFGGKALVEDLDLLLDILADSLRRPTFPPEEAEKLQGQILTDLQQRAHDTQRMARLTFNALLYPDHPYGRSTEGYEETVSRLGRDHLLNYYRERFSPEQMVVAVVGAVSAGDVVEKVQGALGDWLAPGVEPDRSIPPAVHLAGLRRQAVSVPGKTQSDVIIGWPGLARSDPDFMKARLANTILGVFGMMGRLGDSVRDQEGLAYYVYSQLEAGLGAGPWLAIAGVNPSNVERAADGILREVRRLRDELVPAGELADSQSFLTGSMPLRLERNEGILSALLDMERYDLGFDFLQRHDDLVNAVTVQDVQDIVRGYLDPDLYAMAVAGPEHNG